MISYLWIPELRRVLQRYPRCLMARSLQPRRIASHHVIDDKAQVCLPRFPYLDLLIISKNKFVAVVSGPGGQGVIALTERGRAYWGRNKCYPEPVIFPEPVMSASITLDQELVVITLSGRCFRVTYPAIITELPIKGLKSCQGLILGEDGSCYDAKGHRSSYFDSLVDLVWSCTEYPIFRTCEATISYQSDKSEVVTPIPITRPIWCTGKGLILSELTQGLVDLVGPNAIDTYGRLNYIGAGGFIDRYF